MIFEAAALLLIILVLLVLVFFGGLALVGGFFRWVGSKSEEELQEEIEAIRLEGEAIKEQHRLEDEQFEQRLAEDRAAVERQRRDLAERLEQDLKERERRRG